MKSSKEAAPLNTVWQNLKRCRRGVRLMKPRQVWLCRPGVSRNTGVSPIGAQVLPQVGTNEKPLASQIVSVKPSLSAFFLYAPNRISSSVRWPLANVLSTWQLAFDKKNRDHWESFVLVIDCIGRSIFCEWDRQRCVKSIGRSSSRKRCHHCVRTILSSSNCSG